MAKLTETQRGYLYAALILVPLLLYIIYQLGRDAHRKEQMKAIENSIYDDTLTEADRQRRRDIQQRADVLTDTMKTGR